MPGYHGPLASYIKLRLCMRRECWERFLFQPLRVNNPDMMYAGIANLRFPLKVGGVENVPGIPGACTTHNFMYLLRGPLGAGTFSGTVMAEWKYLTFITLCSEIQCHVSETGIYSHYLVYCYLSTEIIRNTFVTKFVTTEHFCGIS